MENYFNKLDEESRKLFESELNVPYQCIHDYIQQDQDWQTCSECGNISPVGDFTENRYPARDYTGKPSALNNAFEHAKMAGIPLVYVENNCLIELYPSGNKKILQKFSKQKNALPTKFKLK